MQAAEGSPLGRYAAAQQQRRRAVPVALSIDELELCSQEPAQAEPWLARRSPF